MTKFVVRFIGHIVGSVTGMLSRMLKVLVVVAFLFLLTLYVISFQHIPCCTLPIGYLGFLFPVGAQTTRMLVFGALWCLSRRQKEVECYSVDKSQWLPEASIWFENWGIVGGV